jgi:hypothetical protein
VEVRTVAVIVPHSNCFANKPPVLLFSSGNFGRFAAAFGSLNVTAYREPPLINTFQQVADTIRSEINDPAYTMIGRNIDVLKNTFEASRVAGKVWQIWGGATSTYLYCLQALMYRLFDPMSAYLTHAFPVWFYSGGAACPSRL